MATSGGDSNSESVTMPSKKRVRRRYKGKDSGGSGDADEFLRSYRPKVDRREDERVLTGGRPAPSCQAQALLPPTLTELFSLSAGI